MAVDAQTFRELLSRWASGITIVTARTAEGRPHGMTASSFTSVSLDPPLVLVSVDRRHRTHALIREKQAFGIHILRTGQNELSDRCAGFVGEDGHWLEDVPLLDHPSDAPILADALSWLDCRLWAEYDGGDHTLFVGEIVAGSTGQGEPLLWFARDYHRLAT